MIAKIFAWLTGGGLVAIGRELRQAQKDRLQAQNDEQRIDAEKYIAQLKARRDVLIAEQGNSLTRWIRPAFALPFVIYNAKIILWDKVLGLGATDALSADFWRLQMIVFGAYFLTRPFENAARKRREQR